MKNLGKLKLNSGSVVISDPCYDRGTWCSGTLDDVKKGEWNCFLRKADGGSWGMRNAEITAIHEDIDPNQMIKGNIKEVRAEKLKKVDGKKSDSIFWELTNIDVGVDSGQAGIFDNSDYPAKGSGNGEYGDETSFYGKCCKTTTGDVGAGIFDGCFVSRSGYGDGSYNCFIGRKGDEIVAIQIEFIGDEIEEEI